MNHRAHEINYLYFSFFFITVATFSILYFMRHGPFFDGANLFFMLYALGQSFLEVSFFMLMATLLKRFAPTWCFHLFIGLSFAVLLAHYVDFTLLRLMDTSFSYILKFFFGSGIDHIVTAFLTLNMNPIMIGLIISGALGVPFLGVFFYLFTHRWSVRRPISFSLKKQISCLCFTGASLCLLDLSAYPFLHRLTYEKNEKALPLGRAFFSPSSEQHLLKRSLPPLRPEQMITDRLEKVSEKKELPNIYCFIIETLRSDFIKPDIAPNFSQFAKENITFERTFANANYSNCCWYAILHANFPYHWTAARDQYQRGSPPLRILKKLGYQIRVYSSADFSYFHTDKILFGEKRQLADHLEEYTTRRELDPCDRDALAIKAFARDLETRPSGTVYIFFLDSTHSEYSFPNNFPLKFTPVTDHISYLTISKSDSDLELLKNRYRNSIAYVDSLLGNFFTLLREKGLYEEGIIALTADHGEEFFEEGSLFHGTHLNLYQTAVPIACKFQTNLWKEKIDPARKQMAHIDIFPSIIHYAVGSDKLADLFDGESIFSKQKRPHHLSVLQNGPYPPFEFCLHVDEQLVHFRLTGSKNIEFTKPIDAKTKKETIEALSQF